MRLSLGVWAVCVAGAAFCAGARPASEDALETFLRAYLSRASADRDTTTRYSFAFVSLRDDGVRQAVVLLSGKGWCGSGGCTLLVLEPSGSTYKVVGRIPLCRAPIRVLASKTKGWHDIGIRVEGGGIQPGYEAALPFNGRRYPENPSVPSARRLRGKVAGEVVVTPGAEARALYGGPR